MFRILYVEPDGDVGNKVKVIYFDTETLEILEKEDTADMIIPTRELLPRKHGSPEKLIAELRQRYDDGDFSFEVKSYGSGYYTEEKAIYTSSQNSFIIWARVKERSRRSDLDCVVGYDEFGQEKQAFIKNKKDRFHPRTIILPEERLEGARQHLAENLEGIVNKPEFQTEHFSNGTGYVTFNCTEAELNRLPESILPYTRVLRFQCKFNEQKQLFKTEEEAMEFLKRIKKHPDFSKYADQAIVFKYTSGKTKQVTISINLIAAAKPEFARQLQDWGFEAKGENGKQKRMARQKLQDSLWLTRPKMQMRYFFPVGMAYNPSLPLEGQRNLEIHPLAYETKQYGPYPASWMEGETEDRGNATSSLEQAVNSLFQLYLKHSATIDLEVLEYKKGVLGTGRIFMAILNSQREKKLYVTKEAWHSEEFQKRLLEDFKDKNVQLVFAEDEIEIIALLNRDAGNYRWVIGHNFINYDNMQLSKFNDRKTWYKKSLELLSEIRSAVKSGMLKKEDARDGFIPLLYRYYTSIKSDEKPVLNEAIGYFPGVQADDAAQKTWFRKALPHLQQWPELTIKTVDEFWTRACPEIILNEPSKKTLDQLIEETEKGLHETDARIKQVRKLFKTEKLWAKVTDNILDTLQYTQDRIDLYGNHKLETLAGFKKIIGYEEMEELIRKKTYEGLRKVVEYTIEDGESTERLNSSLLRNAVLESVSVDKPLPSVFQSQSIKNFYDAMARQYFMKLHTYRDRHEHSSVRHRQKLKDRDSPEQLLLSEIITHPKDYEQKVGEVKGVMFYPAAYFNALKDIIRANPALAYTYDLMLEEKNPTLKADLIKKLSSAILVPLDKIKNWMNAQDLTFGQKYDVEQVYKTLTAENPVEAGVRLKAEPQFPKKKDEQKNSAKEKQAGQVGVKKGADQEKDKEKKGAVKIEENEEKRRFSEFELSQTSYIFALEYGTTMKVEKKFGIPLYWTMLYYNNKIAEEITKFRKFEVTGRSSRYFFAGYVPEDIGYVLGEGKALNLNGNQLIGVIGSGPEKTEKKHIYQNLKPLKHEVFGRLVSQWLAGSTIDTAVARQQIVDLPSEERNNPVFRQLSKILVGVDSGLSKKLLQNELSYSLFD